MNQYVESQYRFKTFCMRLDENLIPYQHYVCIVRNNILLQCMIIALPTALSAFSLFSLSAISISRLSMPLYLSRLRGDRVLGAEVDGRGLATEGSSNAAKRLGEKKDM